MSRKDPQVVALEAELSVDLLTLKSEQPSLEDLTARIRDELQTVRSLLPEYRHLRNTSDWAGIHAEAQDKYELAQCRYAELKTDTTNLFERADYEDAWFDAISQRKTIEMIITHARKNPALQAQGQGCLAFAVLLLPAAAGPSLLAL